MADEPYAIIIDGTGAVTERKLGNHNPGTLLPSTITIISNTVNNNIRKVVMQRPLKGMEYCVKSGSLNVITAIGSTPELSYHAARTASTIVLLPDTSSACVCKPTKSELFAVFIGYYLNSYGLVINYSNKTCLE